MKFLLDTCIVSYFFKEYPTVLRNMKKHLPKEIAISVITIYEIEYGLRLNAEKERKLRSMWQSFLSRVTILQIDAQISNEAATIQSLLSSKGKMIGLYDLFIAATATSKNLICVTSNTREFERIPGIITEDWNLI